MRYRVQMESTAGPYEQYEGELTVFCETDERYEIFMAAVRELRRTSFPDRGADCWRMVGHTIIPGQREPVEDTPY